jgi:colanic acid biosynthesis glycosyl transferase WcaI
MHIMILTQYYSPEEVGPAIFIEQLARTLFDRGHRVTVLTSFPNHPEGKVFTEFQGKWFVKENIDGIDVIRAWIYATPSKRLLPRLLNFGSFCASSLLRGLLTKDRPDVIYTLMPPLPLGVTGKLLGLFLRAKVIINVQDIMPYAAVVTGALNNPQAIRIFEGMEKWIYRHVDAIVAISSSFRENIITKGATPEKVFVVPNWADPDAIQPGPRDNEFRAELDVGGLFTVVYSGGFTHNSNLQPLIDAADLLRDEPFAFVLVGDGVRKTELSRSVGEKRLTNLQMKPFQSLERYPRVLQAADVNVVTLSTQAAFASVPSKIFKQMAVGIPIIAITVKGNEVDRLIAQAQCGVSVAPDAPEALADTLRWCNVHRSELRQMGANGRAYLLKNHAADDCIMKIEAVFQIIC